MIFGRRSHRLRRVVLAVLAIVVVCLAYGFAETYRVETKEYVFTSPDLPVQFDGTRVVFIADIHRGPFYSQDRVRSLVQGVETLDPDLIVLGGDYVYLDPEYAASCFEELAQLEAPLGRFAVLGNHDYGDHSDDSEGPGPVVAALEHAGITLLRDGAEWVERDGARLRVAGVDDFKMGTPDLDATLRGAGQDDFVLLVSHNPDLAEQVPPGAVDLMLSGHTHGGQVTFFGLFAFFVPSQNGQKYRTGLVNVDGTTVIVSNGVGTSTIPPMRIFARPQVVVITLQHGTATEAREAD